MRAPRPRRAALLAAGIVLGTLSLSSGCASLEQEWEAMKRDFSMAPEPRLPEPGGNYKPRVVDPRPLIGEKNEREVVALPRPAPIPPPAPEPVATTAPVYGSSAPVAKEASLIIGDIDEEEVVEKAPAKAKPAEPERPATYKVKNGDTLTHIAQRFYGSARRWRKIYDANRDKLRGPDQIRFGQVLTLP